MVSVWLYFWFGEKLTFSPLDYAPTFDDSRVPINGLWLAQKPIILIIIIIITHLTFQRYANFLLQQFVILDMNTSQSYLGPCPMATCNLYLLLLFTLSSKLLALVLKLMGFFIDYHYGWFMTQLLIFSSFIIKVSMGFISYKIGICGCRLVQQIWHLHCLGVSFNTPLYGHLHYEPFGAFVSSIPFVRLSESYESFISLISLSI